MFSAHVTNLWKQDPNNWQLIGRKMRQIKNSRRTRRETTTSIIGMEILMLNCWSVHRMTFKLIFKKDCIIKITFNFLKGFNHLTNCHKCEFESI